MDKRIIVGAIVVGTLSLALLGWFFFLRPKPFFTLVNGNPAIHVTVASHNKLQEVIQQMSTTFTLRHISRLIVTTTDYPISPSANGQVDTWEVGPQDTPQYGGFEVAMQGTTMKIALSANVPFLRTYKWKDTAVASYLESLLLRALETLKQPGVIDSSQEGPLPMMILSEKFKGIPLFRVVYTKK